MKRGERPPLSRTFLALQNRNYRLFWFGQIVSLTGTWMQNIALAWLVLRVTNSPFALGTVTTIQFTPILLFSLFGAAAAYLYVQRNRDRLLPDSSNPVQAVEPSHRAADLAQIT